VPSQIDGTTEEPEATENAVASNADLQRLFSQYPELRQQLKKIYAATQRPDNSSLGSASHQRGTYRGRGGRGGRDGYNLSEREWTPERGFQQGLKALQRLGNGSSFDAEALQAFEMLIARANNTEYLKHV